MKVEIEVEPGHEAYMLSLRLADAGADYDKQAYEWDCLIGEGKKDEVYRQLKSDAQFFYRLSRNIAKQTAAVVVKPVEVGDAATGFVSKG